MGEHTRRIKYTPAWIMAVFALFFALLSLVNHYLFRTAALDLGLYNHTLYDYAHFKFNYSPLLQPQFNPRNQLSDHFDLMLMLLSPLCWIFGSLTLLLVQIAAILWGGYGVNQYFQSDDKHLATLLMIQFYCIWGIWSALSFDYHSNVIAAMMVPWICYYAKQNHWRLALLYTLLAIICKENMALWMAFVWLGIAWTFRHEKTHLKKCLTIAASSMAWFVLLLYLILPALVPVGDKYIHFNYTAMGSTPVEAIGFLLHHPVDAFKLLFTDPTDHPLGIWAKPELHIFIFFSGGFALILQPRLLFMLIPIYAQKLFHTDFVKWGIYYHYSIEYVPIISLALGVVLLNLKPAFRYGLFAITLASTLFMTNASFGDRYSKWFSPETGNPFAKLHYTQRFDPMPVHRALSNIPSEYAICVNSRLAPHLTNREKIYTFPFTKPDIDLIVLFADPETPYPCSNAADYHAQFDQLKQNSRFEAIPAPLGLIAFRKKGLRFSF